MANNKLILRNLNSPWVTPVGDVTKGSVLSWADMDNNFIYLRGEVIHSAQTNGSTITLKKINGNDLSFNVDSSGNTFYIEVSYSELTNLISSSGLTEGSLYLITDFQTIYDQPDFDSGGSAKLSVVTKSGATEPIVVLSTSINTLAVDAYQPLYPFDTIKYDHTFTQTEVMGVPAKGRITERIDDLNNRTNYDHRTVLFKRYETINTSGVFNSYKDTGFASQEFYTFNGGGNGRTKIGDSISDDFLLPNNVFMGKVLNNIMGPSYLNNTFLGICRDNNIGNSFQNNILGDNFSDNTMGNYCYDNIIGNNFFYNLIGNEFTSNNISGSFSSNQIANIFQFNNISGTFGLHSSFGFGNRIADRFVNNTITNLFFNNVIGVQCELNTIYSMQNNIIGDYFIFNNISSTVLRCDFGVFFWGNTINCSWFRDNIIYGGWNSGNSTRVYNNIFSGTTQFQNNFIAKSIFRYNTINNQQFTDTNIYGDVIGYTFSGSSTLVATEYTKEIIQRVDGTPRIKYMDNTDAIIVDDITT